MITVTRKYVAFFNLLIAMFIISANLNNNVAQGKNEYALRFEHLAANVADPIKVAEWYKENLGLKLMRKTGLPTNTRFMADPDGNMMFEFFYNAAAPLFDASEYDHESFHMAFSVPDIDAILEKVIKSGVDVVDYVKKTSSRNGILNLRDPWGLPIQFVQRTVPILKQAGELRFEHIAINVENPEKTADWYRENLNMIVVSESQKKGSNYNCFLADVNKNFMVKLYHNNEAPVIDFNKVSVGSLHLASVTTNMDATNERIIKAGAKDVDPIIETPDGDLIFGLGGDPWGFPLQFVTRTNPMLK